MSGREGEALGPLWSLALGVGAAAAGSRFAAVPVSPAVPWVLAGLGAASVVLALRRGFGREAAVLWLLAGLTLGGARGLVVEGHSREATLRSAGPAAAVRVQATLIAGWTRSRWGRRTRVSIRSAVQNGVPVPLPHTAILEVRSVPPTILLPAPGSRIEALARVRTIDSRPLLIASSPSLVDQVSAAKGLHRLRSQLVSGLFESAGTSPRRIRAAELAGALALGRRDLMPAAFKTVWRSSGLAHLLAVSGLHVGLVAGLAWYLALVLGASPTQARVLVLTTVPAYAVLAGAAPSALRATLMIVAYVGARLLGRAVVPMAAVLLAVVALLLAAPGLIGDAGFQLTVGITAALIRWAPALASRLPGPSWFANAVAVPLIAQAAAAPIVAWHFRNLIPGAVLTNLLALPFLFPTLALSLTATFIATIWTTPAAVLLSLLSLCARLLLFFGEPARRVLLTSPSLPFALIIALLIIGVAALWPGRAAVVAAGIWLTLTLALPAWWFVRPQPADPSVRLLPVAEGLAALLPGQPDPILVDGGRWRRQVSQLLADRSLRRLAAVVASHTDEDHIGGLETVLRRLRVDALILPAWMGSRPESVPLLRAARRSGARIVPVAAGLITEIDGDRIRTLWPPAVDPPRKENDRSVVARVEVRGGSVLITSDVSSNVERRLLRRPGELHADVLLAAHHGSRSSSSVAFLSAADPDVVLIPAAPLNPYHHPHAEVLRRLERLHIPYRYPKRDGSCGAVKAGHRWQAEP